jgi:hypothetical protein
MTTSMTAVQGWKSLAGIPLACLGFDAAAGHLSPLIWFLVDQVFPLLFWGALEGSRVQFPIQPLSPLVCPVELLTAFTPLLRALAGAV